MRRPRRIAWITAAMAATSALFVVDSMCGVTALGVFPVAVTATFVDDSTGEPIEGVSVLTLREASDAVRPSFITDARERARQRADLPWPARPWLAAGESAADGSVHVTADVRWCRHMGPLSARFRRNLPPYRWRVRGRARDA